MIQQYTLKSIHAQEKLPKSREITFTNELNFKLLTKLQLLLQLLTHLSSICIDRIWNTRQSTTSHLFLVSLLRMILLNRLCTILSPKPMQNIQKDPQKKE